jgi:non-heme chloroperoxidase
VHSEDGSPLAVMDWGDRRAPAILLIHGAGFSSAFWAPQLASDLGKTHHMVAFDLRAHGGSAKPWDPAAYAGSKPWADDVAAVIKATGITKPLIIGWSFGGYVAMDYIREFGQSSVSGLMLVSSTGGFADRLHPFTPGYAEAAQARNSLDLATRIRGEEFFVRLFSAAPLSASVAQSWLAQALAVPVYARLAMGATRLDNKDLDVSLTVPTEFILGSLDRTMPFQDIAAVVHKHPNMQLIVYNNAGHAVSFDQSKRFNADVALFDSKLVATRSSQ